MLKKYRMTNIYLWIVMLLLFAALSILQYIMSEGISVVLTIGLMSFAWAMLFIIEVYAENRFQQKLRHYILKGFDEIEMKQARKRIKQERNELRYKKLMLRYLSEIPLNENKREKLDTKRIKISAQLTNLDSIEDFYNNHSAEESV